MPQIAIADSFLDAMKSLDPVDTRRAAAFLDKLVRAPAASSLRPEIVHDAADRAVRSFKVTRDMRAIARIDGGQVLLLFVARHDRAYAWARGHCVNCHPVTGELLVVRASDAEERELCDEDRAVDAAVAGRPLAFQLCSNGGGLCRILTAEGIEHGLQP